MCTTCNSLSSVWGASTIKASYLFSKNTSRWRSNTVLLDAVRVQYTGIMSRASIRQKGLNSLNAFTVHAMHIMIFPEGGGFCTSPFKGLKGKTSAQTLKEQ